MKVLLVEDEPNVASFISRSLLEDGYEVSIAPDGLIGLNMARQHQFSLIILDIMLPGLNGLEVCKQLRRSGDETPILMLTALGTTENIVTGLDSGADDYLSKPFKLAELLARIRRLTRRNNNNNNNHNNVNGHDAEPTGTYLQLADLHLDIDQKIAKRNNKTIELTATEYRLLEYLLKNKRRVLSRMDILEHVWGIDFNMNTKVVDVYINYLRKKIDKDFEPKLIHTAVGMGYIVKEVYTDENPE